MLRFGLLLTLAVTILSACDSDQSLRIIDPYIFLHDNSSKIWLVDQLLINKNDYTPMRFRYKQMIAFHENRKAYFYTIKDFGSRPGVRAGYTMDKPKREFRFLFDKKEWVFHIVFISRTKLVLRPKYHSFRFAMVLIPFPEY